MEFIDLKSQYKLLETKINKRISDVLNHGKYILGPEVNELEERLADYVGVKHVVTCANGTDALTLSLMALGIGEGDIVFCPTFTFFASAETIVFANAKPVFVDIDPDTFNICPIDLKNKIKKYQKSGLNLKAIMTVDLFGLPANYPELTKIADEYNLLIIEDSAQGFGGQINEKMAGSFGDIATTSFFPAKPLGCYGDGGAIFTDNDEYASLLKSLRVHGKGKNKYDNVRIGLNSRLDTIQAAILLEKLSVFPEEIKKRQMIADIYKSKISTVDHPLVPDGYISSWAQYTIKVDERDKLIKKLSSDNIPSMIYYKTCMHEQTALQIYKEESLKNAELASKTVLSLPMSAYVSIDDINRIVTSLNDF